MNLPDSIEALTETVASDSLVIKEQKIKPNIDDISLYIKQKISPSSSRFFDEGVVVFKTPGDEKSILKGLLSLYSERILQEIKNSSIDDKIKSSIVANHKAVISSIISLHEAHLKCLSELNKNKNILDVEAISYIILGYAIDTLKKIYNSQQQDSF